MLHSWPGPRAPSPTRKGSSRHDAQVLLDEGGDGGVERRVHLLARTCPAGDEVLAVELGVILAVGALAVFVHQHLGDPLLGVGVRAAQEEVLQVGREGAHQRVVLEAHDQVVLARERHLRQPAQQRMVHAGMALHLAAQGGQERARGRAHRATSRTRGSRGSGRSGGRDDVGGNDPELVPQRRLRALEHGPVLDGAAPEADGAGQRVQEEPRPALDGGGEGPLLARPGDGVVFAELLVEGGARDLRRQHGVEQVEEPRVLGEELVLLLPVELRAGQRGQDGDEGQPDAHLVDDPVQLVEVLLLEVGPHHEDPGGEDAQLAQDLRRPAVLLERVLLAQRGQRVVVVGLVAGEDHHEAAVAQAAHQVGVLGDEVGAALGEEVLA